MPDIFKEFTIDNRGYWETDRTCQPFDLLPDIRHRVSLDEDKTVRLFLQAAQAVRPETTPMKLVMTSLNRATVNEVRVIRMESFQACVLKFAPRPEFRFGTPSHWRILKTDTLEKIISIIHRSSFSQKKIEILTNDLLRLGQDPEVMANIVKFQLMLNERFCLDMHLRSPENKQRVIRLTY